MRSQLSNELVSTIDYVNVQQYVESTGWTPIRNLRGDISVYRRRDSMSVQIQIPEDKEYADYGLRMAEVIMTLSKVDDRSPADVLTDLLIPASDIFKIRKHAPNTASGTVPLEEALDFYNGVEQAFLSSADAVMSPQKFYKRHYKNARKFAASCRLGQSERGSYVSTIICPLDMDLEKEGGLELAVEQANDSYPRQVTKLFMDFTRTLIRAAERNAIGQILDAQSVQTSLSANFCTAIAKMEPYGNESMIEIKPFWSKAFPIHEERFLQPIEIKKEYFPIIKQLAGQLRPPNEPVVLQLVGKVDALEGEPDQDGEMNGNIRFRFEHDNEVRLAKIFLTPRDYAKACDAHRDDTNVVVTGELKIDPKKRLHTIQDYVQFVQIANL